MSQSSTIVTLPQLCDAALLTPEVGIVNFTLLRTILHAFIKQCNLTETKVEYRGEESERIQSYLSKSQPGTQILTEYSISGDKATTDAKPDQVLVVTSKPSEKAQFTVTMTPDYLDHMEKSIKHLESKIKELEDLPGNMKLYEAIKQEESTSPVLDMFQILNLQKRMDAVDMCIEKLASLVEEVVRGSDLSGAVKSRSAELVSLVKDEDKTPSYETLNALELRVKALEDKIEKKSSKTSRSSKESIKRSSKTETQTITDSTDIWSSIKQIEDEIRTLKEQVIQSGKYAPPADDELCPPNVTGMESEGHPVEVRIKELANKHTELLDQLNSLDNGFSRLANIMQGRIDDTEKTLGEILEKLHLIPLGDSAMDSSQNLEGVQKQLASLEADFETVIESINKLSDEKAAKEHAIDVLIEQIELLKTVKADREDLEDALADKADACQINRKVSYEQFDQAYGDMNKNLEDALAKLSQQESLWTQTLLNLQGEVTSKMDKNELTPLREFINNKLKSLQEKFKTISAMKKEQEAAGTKSRFLKNVNCISCDKDVIMRRDIDPSMYPKPYALPPTKSMGPYLAYELDQLRKQQKCVPNNKNMNVFENALLTSKSGKSPDHVCNRYCGGSHTVTTPQQRVTRLGHFMEQWGPEIAPVVETNVRGTDGKMYKARDDEHLRKLAADKPPSVLGDSAAPAVYITGEFSSTENHESAAQSETNPTSHPSLAQEPKGKSFSARVSVGVKEGEEAEGEGHKKQTSKQQLV